ncbi:MAG: transglycosylase domain-containing protein, partial [Deltaproteobacteria bacterium]|nr:transglycosylase domain-containing protein [Deltaproteobacteria bacterium]
MAQRRKFIFWVVTLLVLTGLVAGVSVGLVLSVTRIMPQIEALEEFKPIAATRVFSADNRLIAQFFIRKRLLISLSDVPEHLKHAVISIEDRRFYRHAGLDVIRNFGALINDLRTRSLSQGASTITQQLARTLFLSLEKKISRKFAEIFLALQIEGRYTKDEILELYLNQIPFGPGIYGVGAAAEIYLGKKVSELTVPESALLAGLPRWPAGYSPFNHPERAVKRRNVVLKVMLRDGYLSSAQYDEAVNTPLKTAEHGKGQSFAPYFSEYIRQELVERFGHNMVYQGGLRVETTLDYGLQEKAEKALISGVASLAERLGSAENAPENEALQGALVVLEPGTGRILAMVGGKDFNESRFNRATQALRQPGSAFKPIVYAAAIENGSTQAEGIWDAPVSFDIPGR